MPTRKFTDYAKSGLIPEIYLGGVTAGNEVVTFDTLQSGGPYTFEENLTIGNTSAANLTFDTNEVMARNNGATASLYLNQEGGDVFANGSRVVRDTTETITGTWTFSSTLYAMDTSFGVLGSGIFLDASEGIYFEGKKHSITWNDGTGDFNWRVGHINGDSGEVCTEAGYAFWDTYTQLTGLRELQVSSASLAVDDTPTWWTAVDFTPTITSLYASGSLKVEASTDVKITNADFIIRNTANTADAMKFFNTNNVALYPDILFNGSGVLAFDENCYINIDSNNDSTTQNFIVGKNTTTSSATKLFQVKESGQCYIPYNTNASLSADGGLTIGNLTDLNVTFDENEIIARDNGAASILKINQYGGDVYIPKGALYSEAWATVTSFTNSWVQVSGYTVRYKKYPNGDVRLEGRVSSGTILNNNTGYMFQLPTGYRPFQACDFVTIGNLLAMAQIQVTPAGYVWILRSTSNTNSQVWTALNAISFSTRN